MTILNFYIFYKDSDSGNLTFVYNDYDDSIITSLYIEKEYRGMGMGKYLLLNFYNYVRENYPKIKRISLDDCSDNFRCKNNIYLKVGAKYVGKSGPEMIWMIKNPKRIKPIKEYKIIIK